MEFIEPRVTTPGSVCIAPRCVGVGLLVEASARELTVIVELLSDLPDSL